MLFENGLYYEASEGIVQAAESQNHVEYYTSSFYEMMHFIKAKKKGKMTVSQRVSEEVSQIRTFHAVCPSFPPRAAAEDLRGCGGFRVVIER